MAWADNPWRPFCSERCQMMDLGRWANEEYRVPSADPSVPALSSESRPGAGNDSDNDLDA
jgi:endogenous inhibitor of DNA gyrase (YacG/DUF329 family)